VAAAEALAPPELRLGVYCAQSCEDDNPDGSVGEHGTSALDPTLPREGVLLVRLARGVSPDSLLSSEGESGRASVCLELGRLCAVSVAAMMAGLRGVAGSEAMSVDERIERRVGSRALRSSEGPLEPCRLPSCSAPLSEAASSSSLD
jgi:hypothetical protein